VSNAVVGGYSEHRKIGRRADLHSECCPAGVRHREVSNEHPLVIQKILSHLNAKNDEVVEFVLVDYAMVSYFFFGCLDYLSRLFVLLPFAKTANCFSIYEFRVEAIL
jgi:hypothetical protein